MAPERNAADQAGSGMSAGGAGRDSAGLNAGTSGSAAMGDATGGAEVRAGLHSGRNDEYSGIAFAQGGSQEHGLRDRAASTAHNAADTAREQAANVGGRAGDLASQARDKAGDLASQARSTVSGALDRANTALDNRGLLGKLQDNPLPVLGVAFAAGFLLAGGNEERMLASTGMGGGSMGAMGRPRVARARQDLRSAVIAGLSAGLAQGTRSFLNTAGRPEGFLNTFLQSLSGQMQSAAGGMPGAQQGRGQGSMGARPQGGGQGRPQGGMGSSGAGSMGSAGSRPVHREPSHRENL